METRCWPALNEKDGWLPEAIERQLRESTQSAEGLRAHARELRAEAEQTDLKGIREAAQALADCCEQAAAERTLDKAPARSAGAVDEIE